MILLELLAWALFFNGATPEDNYVWHQGTEIVNRVNLTIIETDNSGVECVGHTGVRSRACSTWAIKNGLSSCTIIIQPNEPAVVLAHEKLHCLGWQHGAETIMGTPMPSMPEDVKWEVIQHIKR